VPVFVDILHGQEQKKPTWRNTPREFDHVGLLVIEPPGTAGLLFI